MGKNQPTKKAIGQMRVQTARRRRIMEALEEAVAFCGYDMEEVFSNRSRARVYTDLRSIIWSVYKNATQLTELQMSAVFPWDRSTIWYSILKAEDLRKTDINFADLYDSIDGAFNDALARKQEATDKQSQTS